MATAAREGVAFGDTAKSSFVGTAGSATFTTFRPSPAPLSDIGSPAGGESTAEATLPRYATTVDWQEKARRCLEINAEDLDLSDRPLGDEGAVWLSNLMTELQPSSLRRLLFQRINITPEGCSVLGDVIKQVQGVQVVDIGGNDVGPTGLQGGLTDGILDTGSITSLSLKGCLLEDRGIPAVCEIISFVPGALAKDLRLEHLNLSCNKIGLDGVKCLRQALAENTSLRSLDLSANVLGADAVEVLLEGLAGKAERHESMLKRNGVAPRPWKGIQELNLCQNQLQLEGVMMLAKHFASPAGSILLRLDLCHNAVPNQGVAEVKKELGQPVKGDLHGWVLQFDGGVRQMRLNAF